MVPYLRRSLAVDTNVKPTIFYYGNGRAAGVAPTMELEKVDGLGQGKVSSTAHWIVCAKYVLKEVRKSFEESGTDCAFIDDLTQLLAISSALDIFDATKAALATAGGRLNMS